MLEGAIHHEDFNGRVGEQHEGDLQVSFNCMLA